jgi:di/tricarboxylate transporter
VLTKPIGSSTSRAIRLHLPATGGAAVLDCNKKMAAPPGTGGSHARQIKTREGTLHEIVMADVCAIAGLAGDLSLVPVPAGLNVNQWHYFAVFAAVITGLILESMPVGAVGLIGLTVAGVGGYVDARSRTSRCAGCLSGFAESTVWLIVGAFVFSIGYRKSQLGRQAWRWCWCGASVRQHASGSAMRWRCPIFLLAPATPSQHRPQRRHRSIPSSATSRASTAPSRGRPPARSAPIVMWTAFAATAVTSSLFFTALAPNAAALADRQEDCRCRRRLVASGSSASRRWASCC